MCNYPKIKTRSFFIAILRLNIFTYNHSLSFALCLTLSLSIALSLSHRSWLSIFLLFSRQPNRIQSLPLSCSTSRSRSRSLAFALSQILAVDFPIIFQATKQILDSIFLLFSLRSGIYSISLDFDQLITPIIVFDQLDLKFQCLGFFFFFSQNLIQVDFNHFNYLLDMNVSFNFEFKFLFECLCFEFRQKMKLQLEITIGFSCVLALALRMNNISYFNQKLISFQLKFPFIN